MCGDWVYHRLGTEWFGFKHHPASAVGVRRISLLQGKRYYSKLIDMKPLIAPITEEALDRQGDAVIAEMGSQGKVSKVLLPSTKAGLAWEVVEAGGGVSLVGRGGVSLVGGGGVSLADGTGACYLPGDHRLGLPLDADAHNDILTFSY